MWHPRSKYNARRTEYNGRVYSSTKEANYAAELDLLLRAKEIQSWVPQYRLKLVVNGVTIATYICDFLVIDKDGKKLLIEIKGMETDVFKLKWKLVQALYGTEFIYKLVK